MSFAVPRNVPSFTNPQRQYEDKVWGSSGSVHHTSKGVSSIFRGSNNELPLYKDKPYSTYGRRKRDMILRKRVFLAVVGLVVFLFWFFGGSKTAKEDLTDSMPEYTKKKTGKSSWGGSKKSSEWVQKREQVKDAFLSSWKAYETYAWGFDVFAPVSKRGEQMTPKGMGWIIVDALDTLMIMGLKQQLAHAREWVATTLNYDQDQEVNTFETTIRMMGGLLSAHYLSTVHGMDPGSKANEDLYLEKCSDLADRLSGAYKSKSGIPYASVNLKTQKGVVSHADGGASSTAEATTLQLEMKYLSQLTGEVFYWEIAEKVMQVIDDNMQKDGLLPIFVYADTGTFRGTEIRLGSRGDSYYEYLLKQYIQTNQTESVYADMWHEALAGVKTHMVRKSKPKGFTFIGELLDGIGSKVSPKMDHLVCFMPGNILLGATNGSTIAQVKKKGLWNARAEDDYNLAKELMRSCYEMYRKTPTGLAPEITWFNDFESAETDLMIKTQDAHNLQRPETVESLFIMWRITQDPIYREWGWNIFEAFRNHSMIEGGAYTSIDNVLRVPVTHRDNMESFWLAETLKYLYLLFSDNDILPLDKVVFNTEAHPLPIFSPRKILKTGWGRKPRHSVTQTQTKYVTKATPAPTKVKNKRGT